MKVIARYYVDESGATAIEYALIASLISIAIIGALAALNNSQTGMFALIRDNIVPALGGELDQ